MLIENVKDVRKGALIAKFDVVLDNMGVTIRDCSYFNKNGKKWIGMPARQFEKDGKQQYFKLVLIDKEKKPAFERKCFDLLKHEHGIS